MSDKKTHKKLPAWLGGQNQHIMKETPKENSPTEPRTENLPIFSYSGPIKYCADTPLCDQICNDIRKRLTCPTVVGFDLEWPVSYVKGKEDKVALLQLATDSCCYLFHIAPMKEFPNSLKQLLQSEKITFTGVGIENDFRKLKRNFDIPVASIIKDRTVNLSKMANIVLNTSQQWSLANLTAHLLGKRLRKDPKIRKGRWNIWPLTKDQKLYAANDAYVALCLYRELEKMRDKAR